MMKKMMTAILGTVLAASLLAGCAAQAPAAAPAPAAESTVETVAEPAAEAEAPAEAAEEAEEAAAGEEAAAPVEEAEGAAEETSAEAAEVTITDHADRTVTVPTDPQSVVILDILPLPSVLTVYLGSAESIIAMEPASMKAAQNGILSELYPEILNARTDIMDGEDVNVESILAMDPDIVYYNAGNTALCEKLENAGLTAVAVSPTKWKYDCIVTYDEWISLLQQIYPSRSLPADVSAYSSEVYAKIGDVVKDIPDEERQKVLFLFQYNENTMITSGASFFGQWWCDAVGAKNSAEPVAADNANAVITMEQVYEWDPDVIIITNFTEAMPQDLYDNAIGDDDWSTVKAVKDKRVYKMPLGTYRTYTPGVDTPMTLEWLAKLVYPELFADLDVIGDVKAYYQELYGIELTEEQIDAMYNPTRDAAAWN